MAMQSDYVKSAIAVVGIYIAWRFLNGAKVVYDNVDNAVDSVVDPLADAYFKLMQDPSIEHSEFSLSRLHRDFFDANWQMLPQPREVYRKAYPQQMSEILTVEGKLKTQYRAAIK